MKRLVFLFVGLLLATAAILAGCSSAENSVEPSTGTTTTTTTSAATTSATTQTTTDTSTTVAAPVSSCVDCHTDKAKLIANSPEETETTVESSGEG